MAKQRSASAAANQQVFWRLAQIVVALGAVAVGLYLWYSTRELVKDVLNAGEQELREVLLSDKPHLFYCKSESQTEVPPSYFSDFTRAKGSRMGFAYLNCSQLLPSGKTIAEKFKLKTKWRPMIFGRAPWSGVKQVPPYATRDSARFAEFVNEALQPRSSEVTSDKELHKVCGFSNSSSSSPSLEADVRSEDKSTTCVIFVKGDLFSSVHSNLEQRVIQSNPKVRFGHVLATRRRLSIEGKSPSSAESFALSVYALRNRSHFIRMTQSVTSDYVDHFITKALATPSDDFAGHHKSPVKVVKAKTASFKQRGPPPAPPRDDSEEAPEPEEQQKPSRRRRGSSSNSREQDTPSSSSQKTEMDSEEVEAERLARERRRREEMEDASQHFQQRNAEEDLAESEDSMVEEEEDIIEL